MFRILSMIAVSFSFLVSSFAAQTLPFFNKKTGNPRIQPKMVQNSNSVIPNFTGHWEGTCQEQNELFSISIVQTPTTFKIIDDNFFVGEYELGGVNHQTSITNYGENLFSQSAAFWNPHTHILSVNIVENSMGSNSIFPMSTSIFELKFSLDHDQLKLEADAHFFEGASESEPQRLSCTLSKTQEPQKS